MNIVFFECTWSHGNNIIGIYDDDVNCISTIIADDKVKIYFSRIMFSSNVNATSIFQFLFKWIRKISSCATDLMILALDGFKLCHIFKVKWSHNDKTISLLSIVHLWSQMLEARPRWIYK